MTVWPPPSNFVLYDPNLSEDENEKRHALFQATHGMPGPHEIPDIHKPKWHVVGILKPTHTPNDRVLFIPVITLYAIAEHEEGLIDQAMKKEGYDPGQHTREENTEWLSKRGWDPERLPLSLKKFYRLVAPSTAPAPSRGVRSGELMTDAKPATPPPEKEKPKGGDDDDEPAYKLLPNGDIEPFLPKDEWEISAILIKTRGGIMAQQLMYNFKTIVTDATAVSPAIVMQSFFDTFLKSSALILLVIAFLVTIVAGVGILVSIYNSVSARSREIAILRALGGDKQARVDADCVEAGLRSLG